MSIPLPHPFHQPTPLLQARQLGYSIEQAPLLCEVSVTLHVGEIVGLIGPNGAGKSTLLRALGGLRRDISGEIDLMGKPLHHYSIREIARRVATVPQSTDLDFAFTVKEVVSMGRNPYLGRFQIEGPEDRRIVSEAMQALAITEFAERHVNTLSGGERQRVFIARALAQQPKALLLDEPIASLDVHHQIEVMQILARLAHQQGMGLLAAIHDLDLAAYFCDRLILLHQGQIIADDVPEAVLTPDHLEAAFNIRAYTFRDPFNDALRLSLELDAV